MGRLDLLPADQRAVVGLVLRQGKSYDDLSGLLNLDAGAVRERAHAALTALGPEERTNGLDAERRGEVADYLLGQGSEADREAARVYLAGSDSGRAWARDVAAELAPIAPAGLPEIPGDPAPPGATAAAPPETDPAAPRVSRTGGAILLGLLAVLIATAVAAALLFGASSDDGQAGGRVPRTTSTATSTTATGASATTVQAQANLTAPAGAPAPKALGIVRVLDSSGQRRLVAIVQGLPKPGRDEGFGIWLTAPSGRRAWLGFFQTADLKGRLIAQGPLRRPITGFDQMLVTREKRSAPKRPGRVYVRGRIVRPSGATP
jgi:Anti-sigma-K factor rskA, C-terminal